ncbi:MAG: FAD-dependent oxidoreductase [Saprospiraceae bacterium]|nr:FAD-dependent oxidoreductase [Saprospiraceae bacterium]
MKKTVELKLFPNQLNEQEFIWERASSLAKISLKDVSEVTIIKRSIDARGSRPVYRLRCDVYANEHPIEEVPILSSFKNVGDQKEVFIVGAGPAGYFAALRLIKEGLKPIVLDRGKDVRARRRDLRAIQQFGEVNPHSNYCFGEGGAGTYSDGKLYTRSQKRGKIVDVLRLLVEHGATSDIMIDAHPHIGSNKLPNIVSNIRETILEYGGEVRFDSHVTDFNFENGRVKGLQINNNEWVNTDAIILATGHSARDIYTLLDRKKVYMEAKPFALGLRIEHAQSLIDSIQYNQPEREENLPAASYSVVAQINGVGVFSFCMCPGGLIVPAATAPGEIVVNGMSLSRRDSPFANSGFVTAISVEELNQMGYKGVFGTMNFQKEVEQKMFNAGDGSQKAPAQRVTDFVEGKLSTSLNDCSYIPGLHSARVDELLPDFVSERLKKGVVEVGKKMRGYYTANANFVGVESRTSSPVKIPRNRESFMHEGIEGLFPCGEGAGYAGGILSACMDGENVASAVKRWVLSQ